MYSERRQISLGLKKYLRKSIKNIKKICRVKILLYLCNPETKERVQVLTREHSSVGLEHLPYKQRVGGSTPSAPTKSDSVSTGSLFSFIMSPWLQKG